MKLHSNVTVGGGQWGDVCVCVSVWGEMDLDINPLWCIVKHSNSLVHEAVSSLVERVERDW